MQCFLYRFYSYISYYTKFSSSFCNMSRILNSMHILSKEFTNTNQLRKSLWLQNSVQPSWQPNQLALRHTRGLENPQWPQLFEQHGQQHWGAPKVHLLQKSRDQAICKGDHQMVVLVAAIVRFKRTLKIFTYPRIFKFGNTVLNINLTVFNKV